MVPDSQFPFCGLTTWLLVLPPGFVGNPIKMLAFGVNYRYQTTMDYQGHSSTSPSPPLLAAPSLLARP